MVNIKLNINKLFCCIYLVVYIIAPMTHGHTNIKFCEANFSSKKTSLMLGFVMNGKKCGRRRQWLELVHRTGISLKQMTDSWSSAAVRNLDVTNMKQGGQLTKRIFCIVLLLRCLLEWRGARRRTCLLRETAPSSVLAFDIRVETGMESSVRGKRLLAPSCLIVVHVSPLLCPVRMEQLGSHWTDFHEIWLLSTFR